MEDMTTRDIPQIILRGRRALELTQAALAMRLGVNKKTVSKWESGKQSPTRHLVDLERVLGVRLTDEPMEYGEPHDRALLSDDQLYIRIVGDQAELYRRLSLSCGVIR